MNFKKMKKKSCYFFLLHKGRIYLQKIRPDIHEKTLKKMTFLVVFWQNGNFQTSSSFGRLITPFFLEN